MPLSAGGAVPQQCRTAVQLAQRADAAARGEWRSDPPRHPRRLLPGLLSGEVPPGAWRLSERVPRGTADADLAAVSADDERGAGLRGRHAREVLLELLICVASPASCR